MKKILSIAFFVGLVASIAMTILVVKGAEPIEIYIDLLLVDQRNREELRKTRAELEKLNEKTKEEGRLLLIKLRQDREEARLAKEIAILRKEIRELLSKLKAEKKKLANKKNKLKSDRELLKILNERIKALDSRLAGPLTPFASGDSKPPPPEIKMSPEDIKKIQRFEKQRDAHPLRR